MTKKKSEIREQQGYRDIHSTRLSDWALDTEEEDMRAFGRKKVTTSSEETKKIASGANKNTKALKELVAGIVAGGLPQFEQDINMIKDPKDRCDIMLKLMQFVLPKVSATEVTGNLELDSVSNELTKLSRIATDDFESESVAS